MSFTCPVCLRTSHNPHDEREGYCGVCHDWTRGKTAFCSYYSAGQRCRAIGKVRLRVEVGGHAPQLLLPMCKPHAEHVREVYDRQGFETGVIEK